MDEIEFKNHAEKELWEKLVLAEITSGSSPTMAAANSDAVIAARRTRMRLIASKARAA